MIRLWQVPFESWRHAPRPPHKVIPAAAWLTAILKNRNYVCQSWESLIAANNPDIGGPWLNPPWDADEPPF